MSTARFVVGHTLTVLRAMPDASVDLVLTSPPFLALRSYLPPDHPDKVLEMGSEATPGEYLDRLLDVVEECRRVLAPHGSICVELGDTYAGSGGAGGDYLPGGRRDGQPRCSGRALAVWPLDKSLTLIPELFRFALAYGLNPLTGRGTPRWRVRNVVRWVRPNPPVGALSDKFRPATSELVVACVARDRYFDLDAVRTPSDYDRPNLRGKGARAVGRPNGQRPNTADHSVNAAGAPPLDWWAISPKGYPGAHYATFPEALCVRPIETMCPRQVCTNCGRPSQRIVETTNAVGHAVGRVAWTQDADTTALMHSGRISIDANHASVPDVAERHTLGWTDCGCPGDHWRPGLVLDPFAGSGTTGAVAVGHGRDALLIDLDASNLALARQRIGMFLEESTTETGEART